MPDEQSECREVLKIVQYPHPALLEVSNPVKVFGDDLRWVVGQMRRLLLEHKGVGLAANQVGVVDRLFVAKWPDGRIDTFINPEIVWRSNDESTEEEGCLSWPGHRVSVTRSNSVRMAYSDIRGVTFVRAASGITARCWQHELDHLDGINLANPRALKLTTP